MNMQRRKVGLSAASGAKGLSMLVGMAFAAHGNPSLLYVQRSLVPLATALQQLQRLSKGMQY